MAVAGGFVGTERVYSLAEVQQGRQSNQAAWVGRTVLVRGQLVGVSTGMQSFEEISAPFTWRQRLGFGGLPRRYNVYRPPAPLVRPLIVVRGPGVTGRPARHAVHAGDRRDRDGVTAAGRGRVDP